MNRILTEKIYFHFAKRWKWQKSQTQPILATGAKQMSWKILKNKAIPPSGVQISASSHSEELGVGHCSSPWRTTEDSTIQLRVLETIMTVAYDGQVEMGYIREAPRWRKGRKFCICNVFIVVSELCYLSLAVAAPWFYNEGLDPPLMLW